MKSVLRMLLSFLFLSLAACDGNTAAKVDDSATTDDDTVVIADGYEGEKDLKDESDIRDDAEEAAGDDGLLTDEIPDIDDTGPFPTTVVTPLGAVEGATNEEALYFKGIPYAEPPVGPLRWSPPVDKTPWEGTFATTEFRKACPQNSKLVTGELLEWDEDCLYLNVYRPLYGHAPLPVMFWIHGGGHINGSGGQDIYDGSALAAYGNMVVVTISYRLAQLGFLRVPGTTIAGNYGTMDQKKALEWVQANIASFGGDPANVTVFGESAGGVSTGNMLAVAPTLFTRAIIESAIALYNAQSLAASKFDEQGEAYAQAAGCSDSATRETCLRALSAEEILAIMPGSSDGSTPDTYGPHVDGTFLTDTPLAMIMEGDGKGLPLIIGTNADEGTLWTRAYGIETVDDYEAWVRTVFKNAAFADQVLAQYPANAYPTPREAADDLYADLKFDCTVQLMLRELVTVNPAVRQYRFNHAPQWAIDMELRSFHGLEVGYIFDTLTSSSVDDIAVKEHMALLWTAFASGAAGEEILSQWPQFDATDESYLIIAPEITTGTHLEKAHCDFWSFLLAP